MSYTDITTKKSLLLKDFKQIQDSKGSYIRTKYKNSKRIVSEYNIELQFYHLPAKEHVSCFKNIFKNAHEYRIKKLYDLQQSNMYEIFLCLKDINEQENNNFVFKVSNHDLLMEKLHYLLTDTQEVFINKEMYVFFDKYRNDKKNIQQLINTEKLGKIRQDDFIVVINKILKVIETPKELKYMINLLNEIATKKIFTEETFNCFYKTINNKLIKYLNNIINHNIDNKKLSEKQILKQIHACLVVLDEQKQNLPKKIKKKLLDETLLLYDCFIKNINFDISDTAFIYRQKKANENLIENIIKKIIIAITETPEIINKSIDKKYDYKKNLAHNIINQTQNSANGLEYFIQETKACFNILTDTVQQILDLTLKLDNLKQERIKTDDSTTHLTLDNRRNLSKICTDKNGTYKKIDDLTNIFKKKLAHIMALAYSYAQEHSILKKHIEIYNIDSKNLASIRKYYNTPNIIEYLRLELSDIIKNKITYDNYSVINILNFPAKTNKILLNHIIELIIINATISSLNNDNIEINKTNFDDKTKQIKDCYEKHLEYFLP